MQYFEDLLEHSKKFFLKERSYSSLLNVAMGYLSVKS